MSVTSVEEVEIPPKFKGQRLSLAMILVGFLLISLVSLRAVNVVNDSKEEARQDLADASIRAEQLQEQINCIIGILVPAVQGGLENSIVQNDVLIASLSGGDRAVIEQQLRETRARLFAISGKVGTQAEECIK